MIQIGGRLSTLLFSVYSAPWRKTIFSWLKRVISRALSQVMLVPRSRLKASSGGFQSILRGCNVYRSKVMRSTPLSPRTRAAPRLVSSSR